MGWTLTYWMLWAAFLLSAALNLLHIRAGFLTGYLADVTVPALLYVISRGLLPGKRPRWNYLYALVRWIGHTPERAGAFFFLASSATEVSQRYWPGGLFSGRFDPWDIVSFGTGIAACYGCDKLQRARPAAAENGPQAVQQSAPADGALRRR